LYAKDIGRTGNKLASSQQQQQQQTTIISNNFIIKIL
jgi:hypothetical protein